MKKRMLSLLLTLALLLGLLSICAFAAENLQGDTDGNGTVDVTLTISKGTDDFYQTVHGDYLVKQPLSVPYFDLALYGLEEYYYNPNCYTGSTQTPGTKETAQEIVTTMHVMIYATERFVLGYNDEECGTGVSVDNGLFDHISWTQGAGSSFMSFWNGSTNLNYYLDYQYPLGREGWGSTSDQQALSDGVAIDTHFIVGSATGSQYSFLEREDGVRDYAVLTKGESCKLTLKKTTSSYGSVTQSAAVANETVYFIAASSYEGQKVNEWASLGQTDSNGKITVPDTLDAGTYYLSCMGADESAGERGPAAFVLTVQDAAQTVTPSITATALSENVAVGNTVEVAFAMTNNPGIAANTAFTLTYDTEKLEFVGLKDNEGLLAGVTANGDTITWTGDTVSDDGKLFTAQFKGKAVGDVSVSLTTDLTETVTGASVTVIEKVPATKVTLNYEAKELEVGGTFNLSATVEPSDSTDAVVWSSSVPGVATVSQRGVVTGVGTGTATITATAGSVTATCEVTVKAEESPVKRSPTGYSEFTAATITGIKFIQFNGKNEAVKNIYKLQLTGHEEFHLMVPEETMPQSKAYRLDGTQCFGGAWGAELTQNRINSYYGLQTRDLLVNYADLVAAVGESNASKLGYTECNLLAFLFVNEGAYKYGILFEITPVAATGISIADTLRLEQGKTGDLSVSLTPAASTDTVTIVWNSSDTGVATVDSTGKVTAAAPGTAIITASMGTLEDTCTVTVTKPPVSIPVPENGSWGDGVTGLTVGGVSVVEYKWDGFELYVYTDDETGTADVIYTVENSGTSTISKTVSIQNYEGSCETEIRIGWDRNTWHVYFRKNVPATSLEMNKTTLEVFAGDTATVTATLSEGSTSVATWKSSDEKIATVDQSGNVTGVAEGTATITATAGTLSKTCTVKVKPSLIPAIPPMDGNVVLSKITLLGAEVKSAVWDGYTLNVTLPWNTQDETEITAVFTVQTSGTWYFSEFASGYEPGTQNFEQKVTINNRAAEINAAFDTYDPATGASGRYPYLLKFAVAEKTAADTVIEQIDALPETITMEDESAIVAARTAYDALSEEQKELVTNYEKLTNAETVLAGLKKAKADQEAADEVIALIDAIGEVNHGSKNAIEAAREAYDALSEEQKALVTNYQTLVDAEKAYDELPAIPVVPGTPTTPSKPSTPVVPEAPSFTDISGHWATDAIEYAVANGLMNGVGNGRFAPNEHTTRGMIVTILARLEGVDTSKGATWYEAGQQWAMKLGISDGTNMDGQITREQLAAMLYRYAQLKGYDTSARADLSTFADASSVSDWAQEAMQWAVAKGLIQGSNNQLTPTAPATRAQVATILMRFIG